MMSSRQQAPVSPSVENTLDTGGNLPESRVVYPVVSLETSEVHQNQPYRPSGMVDS